MCVYVYVCGHVNIQTIHYVPYGGILLWGHVNIYKIHYVMYSGILLRGIYSRDSLNSQDSFAYLSPFYRRLPFG